MHDGMKYLDTPLREYFILNESHREGKAYGRSFAEKRNKSYLIFGGDDENRNERKNGAFGSPAE